MNTCVNHPDRKALSTCHGCGLDYCESCLDEGNEYYFCRKQECQKLFKEEYSPGKTATEFVCPNCQCALDLSESERESGEFHCPECEALIDVTVDPPNIVLKENYVELLSSLNQGDIAMLRSVLDDGEIDYYVSGENFLSASPLLSPAKFFVNETQLEQTKELLKDFDFHIWGASTQQ